MQAAHAELAARDCRLPGSPDFRPSPTPTIVSHVSGYEVV